MMNNIFKITILVLVSIFVAFFGIATFTLSDYNKNQINITGTAKKQFNNQLAEFTVVFTSENVDKSIAENQNNEKVTKFLEEVKAFGIPDEDVRTDALNVYQKQEDLMESNMRRTKPTDWVFSQSISIKLKDVSKVNDFTNLASRNQSTNIYGPNFSLNTETIDETEVYNLAFENARKKAESIVKQSGRTLGKVIYISEGGSYNPMPVFAKAMSLSGAAEDSVSAQLPVGSSEVSKTLNIIFEIR